MSEFDWDRAIAAMAAAHRVAEARKLDPGLPEIMLWAGRAVGCLPSLSGWDGDLDGLVAACRELAAAAEALPEGEFRWK